MGGNIQDFELSRFLIFLQIPPMQSSPERTTVTSYSQTTNTPPSTTHNKTGPSGMDTHSPSSEIQSPSTQVTSTHIPPSTQEDFQNAPTVEKSTPFTSSESESFFSHSPILEYKTSTLAEQTTLRDNAFSLSPESRTEIKDTTTTSTSSKLAIEKEGSPFGEDDFTAPSIEPSVPHTTSNMLSKPITTSSATTRLQISLDGSSIFSSQAPARAEDHQLTSLDTSTPSTSHASTQAHGSRTPMPNTEKTSSEISPWYFYSSSSRIDDYFSSSTDITLDSSVPFDTITDINKYRTASATFPTDATTPTEDHQKIPLDTISPSTSHATTQDHGSRSPMSSNQETPSDTVSWLLPISASIFDDYSSSSSDTSDSPVPFETTTDGHKYRTVSAAFPTNATTPTKDHQKIPLDTSSPSTSHATTQDHGSRSPMSSNQETPSDTVSWLLPISASIFDDYSSSSSDTSDSPVPFETTTDGHVKYRTVSAAFPTNATTPTEDHQKIPLDTISPSTSHATTQDHGSRSPMSSNQETPSDTVSWLFPISASIFDDYSSSSSDTSDSPVPFETTTDGNKYRTASAAFPTNATTPTEDHQIISLDTSTSSPLTSHASTQAHGSSKRVSNNQETPSDTSSWSFAVLDETEYSSGSSDINPDSSVPFNITTYVNKYRTPKSLAPTDIVLNQTQFTTEATSSAFPDIIFTTEKDLTTQIIRVVSTNAVTNVPPREGLLNGELQDVCFKESMGSSDGKICKCNSKPPKLPPRLKQCSSMTVTSMGRKTGSKQITFRSTSSPSITYDPSRDDTIAHTSTSVLHLVSPNNILLSTKTMMPTKDLPHIHPSATSPSTKDDEQTPYQTKESKNVSAATTDNGREASSSSSITSYSSISKTIPFETEILSSEDPTMTAPNVTQYERNLFVGTSHRCCFNNPKISSPNYICSCRSQPPKVPLWIIHHPTTLQSFGPETDSNKVIGPIINYS